MDAEPEFERLCERCQAGHLQPRVAALVAWVAGAFITVPSFPSWVCDVCGATEYDAEALEQLQAVLGPQAALRRARRPDPAPAGPRPAGRHRV